MKNSIVLLFLSLFYSCDPIKTVLIGHDKTYSLSSDCGKVELRAAVFGSRTLDLLEHFTDCNMEMDITNLNNTIIADSSNFITAIYQCDERGYQIKSAQMSIQKNKNLSVKVTFRHPLKRGQVVVFLPSRYLKCQNGNFVKDSIFIRI
jgi:hypothetical protein